MLMPGLKRVKIIYSKDTLERNFDSESGSLINISNTYQTKTIEALSSYEGRFLKPGMDFLAFSLKRSRLNQFFVSFSSELSDS